MCFRAGIEVPQESPPTFLLPSLLTPLIGRLGEELNDIIYALIMSNIDEYTVVSIELFKFDDAFLCHFRIRMKSITYGRIEWFS